MVGGTQMIAEYCLLLWLFLLAFMWLCAKRDLCRNCGLLKDVDKRCPRCGIK